ncbi:MAG: acyl-CoA/acyl-ACP dehydrogenase [Actinomycetota bacterium]|nr:acyl-CoA/acyl-ACP dehydrogenase [Actinomycetota bacterium]
MDLRLQPRTAAGKRFVELADTHAAAAAVRSAEHDRDGTFPFEAFEAMKQSGFMTATVPEQFGGLGLNSTHDLTAGLCRLAGGDGSIAIAANMHLVFPLVMRWLQRFSKESGDTNMAEQLDGLLTVLGGGTIAMGNNTEPGTDLAHPLLEATKADGGWTLNGRKIFGTLSPIADLFLASCRTARDDGTYASGNAFVFRGSEGQEIRDNWDALGMRASGSNDVVYKDCFVPESLFFTQGDDWGTDGPLTQVIITAGNIGLLGAFCGIAEAAREQVVEMVKTRTKAPSGRPLAERHGVQHLVAEIDVDLATIRALLERTTTLIDEVVCDGSTTDATLDLLHEVNHQFQCAKLVVNRKAIDIVDRALTLSGGFGYMTASPLARLYRDVRAGPFMQPYSPNEAHEFIGRISLGLNPELE